MPTILSPVLIHDLIQSYGLWVLFAAVAFESMGVPMPGETVLVAVAMYAGSTHGIGILPVVAVAAVAAIVGDNLGYLFGRTVGFRLLLRYGGYLRLHEARLRTGQYLFLRHGGKIVFFGRFIAFLRAFAALLAGVNRMDWPHFLLMNALGGVTWAILFGGGAYLFGEKIELLSGPVGLLLLAVAAILTVVGIVYIRGHEKELEKRAALALPGPLDGQRLEAR